jgi:hypothetical protein
MTVEAMQDSMSQGELMRWALYAGRNGLPFQRLELMLGQVCMLIAQTMGGVKNAKVRDFIPRAPDVEAEQISHIERMKQAFNFRPRKTKRKAR